MNFGQIYEGWKNKLLPKKELKAVIEKISKERMEICKTCSLYNEKGDDGCTVNGLGPCCNKKKKENGVSGCGCTLSAKTRCMGCSCPLEKWKGVIPREEQEKLENELLHGE